MSPEEVLLVKSRGPDPVGDWMYADGVFEGGGVKGFAYLGAIHCFDQAGYKFRKTAGTSAGCLPAVFLAAGVSMDRLTDALCRCVPRSACLRTASVGHVIATIWLTKHPAGVRPIGVQQQAGI